MYNVQYYDRNIESERNHAVQIVYTAQYYDVILKQRGKMQYKLYTVKYYDIILNLYKWDGRAVLILQHYSILMHYPLSGGS